jgi:ribosome-interacting GTPase 1
MIDDGFENGVVANVVVDCPCISAEESRVDLVFRVVRKSGMGLNKTEGDVEVDRSEKDGVVVVGML